MDLTIAKSLLPFRWQGKDYIIKDAGLTNGKAHAKVEPDNPALVKELVARIERDKGLCVYLAFGYTCFVEDYK